MSTLRDIMSTSVVFNTSGGGGGSMSTSSDVLNIPPCTHDIPLMYSWYSPDVLMVSPDVLNTHYTSGDSWE